jgi:hypothetical protein
MYTNVLSTVSVFDVPTDLSSSLLQSTQCFEVLLSDGARVRRPVLSLKKEKTRDSYPNTDGIRRMHHVIKYFFASAADELSQNQR